MVILIFRFAYSEDQLKTLRLLRNSLRYNESKVILMVAPSFVVDFDFKKFVPLMRGLGFDLITELTFGAKIVNKNYHKYIKENKKTKIKFISSVCPLSVNLLKAKYPDFSRFLLPFDSPMIAMAKVLKKHYPKHKIVFVSPCSAKKIESKQFNEKNKKTLIDVVITFSELKQIVAKEKPRLVGSNIFDSFYNEYTKVYPLSGGLTETLHTKHILEDEEMIFSDGCQNLQKLFGSNPDKIFYDILFCEGGCIGGNGIVSKMPIVWKKNKVLKYRKAASRIKEGKKVGVTKYYKGINFRREF